MPFVLYKTKTFIFNSTVFQCFKKNFTTEVFILGFKYVQHRQNVCKWLDFILAQTKLAIYVSRKNKIDRQPGHDVLVVFSALMKSLNYN